MDVREILVNLLGRETVSPAADKAGKSLDRLGDSLTATGQDAKRLDREVEQAEGALRALAVQFARTQDAAERVDLSKQMRRQQTEVRRLIRARDLLPDAGEAASGWGLSFMTKLGPVMARVPMGPAGAAIGGALAVGLVPVLATAVGGAILGGAGVGGVVGGIALAARDSRVKTAGRQLGETVMGDLDESAARFVTPTLGAIRTIRDAWTDVSDEVDDIARTTAGFVEPLADGVAGLVRELGPGLRDGLQDAGPIIREISEGLPRAGAALGDLFRTLGDNADEGASAVRWLFMAFEEGVQFVGGVIDILGDFYRVLLDASNVAGAVGEALWGWIPGLGDVIQHNNDNIDELRGALDEAGPAGAGAGDRIAGGLNRAGDAATGAGRKVRSLQEIMRDWASNTLDERDAARGFEEAVDNATDALKRNGRTLDTGTAKGRENSAALDAIARATHRKAAATLAATGSQDEANAVTEQGRKAFLAAARAMGMEEDAAAALALQLFGIPNVVRSINIRDKQAREAIARVVAAAGRIKDIHRGIYYTVKGDLKVPGGTLLKGLSGGGPVTGTGPKGIDSEARLLAPGEHVLTAAEVDAAGGHAGVERLRAALRSGQPATASGATSTAAPGPTISPADIARAVRAALSGMAVHLDGRAVGAVQGREADLLTRSGY